MERILLIGSTGQVGLALQQTRIDLGELICCNRASLDLSHLETIKQRVTEIQPTVIVNAAAYTAVDQAEQETDLADQVNAKAPGRLAELAREQAATLIHLSTDYVFDGQQSTPYKEDDLPHPLGVYGQSKLAGETAIRESECSSIILRTAWVYSAQGKGNFVKTMLRLGTEREEIRVVADQVGSPTWAQDIATTIAGLIPYLGPETYGTYHYTSNGVASWYDFAVAIFEEARALGFPLTVRRVIPITTVDYSTSAQRPAYSVLACQKVARLLGHQAPHWRQSLRLMLRELLAGNGILT